MGHPSISGKSDITISTFEIIRSLWRSCATFIAIRLRVGYVSVRKTGTGAAFAITQPELRDTSRSSRNGRRESGNEQREDFVQPSNCPTQAKNGLEWATRPLLTTPARNGAPRRDVVDDIPTSRNASEKWGTREKWHTRARGTPTRPRRIFDSGSAGLKFLAANSPIRQGNQ
jgi:hypothetical protein